MPDFYEPEFYDLEVGPGSRISQIYTPLAENRAGPILELGCGTGNILIPLAQVAAECWGLDCNSAMLQHATRKLAEQSSEIQNKTFLEKGDIRSFKLDRSFEAIFLTNDVIAHLLTSEDLVSTFANCKSHLDSGGKVVLDISKFDLRYLAHASNPLNWHLRYCGETFLGDDEKVVVWERTSFNESAGLLSADFRYEIVAESSGDLVRSFDRKLVLRPRRLEEVDLALRCAGFALINYEEIKRSENDDAILLTASIPD